LNRGDCADEMVGNETGDVTNFEAGEIPNAPETTAEPKEGGKKRSPRPGTFEINVTTGIVWYPTRPLYINYMLGGPVEKKRRLTVGC